MRRARLSRTSVTFWSCVAAVPALTRLTYGIRSDSLQASLAAGVILGIFFLTLRPVLKLLTLPIGCMTLGLFSFGIDAALIWALGEYLPGFYVASVGWALLAALFLSGVRIIAGGFNQ
jgi:putative membrane protein